MTVKVRKKQRMSKLSKRECRRGSHEIKLALYIENQCCDICNSHLEYKDAKLHHVYLIRHGFVTKKEHCKILCEKCHQKFHRKFDNYLDLVFEENSHSDFLAIYNVLKKILFV